MSRLRSPDWLGLVERSRVFRLATVLMLALVVGTLAWWLSLRDIAQGHRLAVAQEREVLEALAARSVQAEGLEDARRALESARHTLQEAQWRLDAGEGMSELLDQLAISGHEHGLVFERIDVLDEEQPGTGYRRVPLDVRVVGGYPSLRAWLEQWQQQVRLLEMAHINLASARDKPGLVSAQIRVNAYRPTEALSAVASLADEPARPAVSVSAFDPFQAWSFGAAVQGLGRIPLEQLQMVGSLAYAGRHQALVRAAGSLHRVQEGQRLGRDEGVVVHIDAQRMEVRERLYIAGGWQERSRHLALGKGARAEVMDEAEADAGRGGGAGADEPEGDAGSAGQG